jgi:hypothetical protein
VYAHVSISNLINFIYKILSFTNSIIYLLQYSNIFILLYLSFLLSPYYKMNPLSFHKTKHKHTHTRKKHSKPPCYIYKSCDHVSCSSTMNRCFPSYSSLKIILYIIHTIYYILYIINYKFLDKYSITCGGNIGGSSTSNSIIKFPTVLSLRIPKLGISFINFGKITFTG